MSEFITYEAGLKIREELHRRAMLEYIPIHTAAEYLKFMNANEITVDINHPQSINHLNYFCLFSVVSQHVYGDCIEECLDKAIGCAGG